MTRNERLEHHEEKARLFAKMSTDGSRFSSEERILFAKEAQLHTKMYDKIMARKHIEEFAAYLVCGAGVGLVLNTVQHLMSKGKM